MIRRTALWVGAAAVVSFGGCAHVPKFLSWLRPRPNYAKINAVPVQLAQEEPMAAEDKLYAESVRAIEDRDYGKALDVLQLARDAKPDDARVLTALGVVYDKLGRFDLSNRYYDLAEKADPGSKIVAENRRYSVFLQQHSEPGNLDGTVMLAGEAGPRPNPTSPAKVTSPSVAVTATGSPRSLAESTARPVLKWTGRDTGATQSNLVATADFSVRRRLELFDASTGG